MKFDKKFLLGLFLFIRMLQLSLDRALGGRWESLTKYLSSQPNCRDVVGILSKVCGYDVVPETTPDKPTIGGFNITKSILGAFVLNKHELSFVSWWLLKAADLVERTKSEPSVDAIAEVRLNLAHAEEIIRSRLRNRGQQIEYVEHFNQSDMLKCRSIEQIVGEPWPNA